MKVITKAMSKKRILSAAGHWIAVVLLVCGMSPAGLASIPRSGEAIVAARVGTVQARVFSGTIHEGETRVIDLTEGQSIGEASQVQTAKGGRTCMVLSPGAILCVAPESELTFSQLRHSADGLPKSEDDLVRKIHIELKKGRILMHSCAPTPSMDICVHTAAGTVEADGGTFVVAQMDEGEWAVISEEFGVSAIPAKGEKINLPEGKAASLKLTTGGAAEFKEDSSLLKSPAREFEVCNCFFDDLETFIYDPGGVDRPGLTQYIGDQEGIEFVGSLETVQDVSPATRSVVQNRNRIPATPGQPVVHNRWDNRRTWLWYENIGIVKGVNYVPRNAVNSTEMWMEDSFDPEVIGEEIGWAQDAGYTTLRVQLQYAVWKEDPAGFLDRVNKFLELAEDHDLQVVPVLFDGRNFAQADPVVGPQPEPVPGAYNARWTPSPGESAVKDRSAWPDLERYVKDVIGTFKRDDRVVYWDLYNRAGDDELWETALPLMDQTFNWAREVDPQQPLAMAAWTRYESAMTTRMLERSDIITFQSFESAGQVEALLLLLARYDRPIICSDWLMRQRGNTFENLLPLFSVNHVGWFNQGLVNGKTQGWIQQEKFRSDTQPDLWQHDVFKPDGAAYDEEEIKLVQEFRFRDRL